MIKIVNKKNCSGCKACYNICPRNCIEMFTDEEGFSYPKAEVNKCVNCGLCEKVCPQIEICVSEKAYAEPTCLAAWNKNSSVRENSSSGGIFTSLAGWIIGGGGVVFGAGYDDDHKVIHKEVHKIEELSELRGSKYVQSDIKDSYNSAKKYLDKGKYVLFTGTPCQIAGLNNFLQREYAQLYTCDIVCHGVPSPMVFEKYKHKLEEMHSSKLTGINFRNKKNGWKSYKVAVQFENRSEYSKSFIEDAYMKGFLRNYYLRPSCYSCEYAKLPRTSDITLGDFWGLGGKYPELDDDKGTSLILINTDKGKAMLKEIEASTYQHECALQHAIEGNPSLISSVKIPRAREKFFKDLQIRDFNYIINKYMSAPSAMEKKLLFAKRALRYVKKRIMNSIKV